MTLLLAAWQVAVLLFGVNVLPEVPHKHCWHPSVISYGMVCTWRRRSWDQLALVNGYKPECCPSGPPGPCCWCGAKKPEPPLPKYCSEPLPPHGPYRYDADTVIYPPLTPREAAMGGRARIEDGGR